MQFYFHIALLVIGLVGTVSNGLILYALVASKQHKKHVLIVHQNVLDLVTSFLMVVTYSVKLCNIPLSGFGGYLLCTLVISESVVWFGTFASVLNLASITIERYLKVVHHVWSNNRLRNWMIYSAMVFSWIVSFIFTIPAFFATAAVIDGTCYAMAFFAHDSARTISLVLEILFFYVIILLVFIFCYWRILVVIRRQAKVMASHSHAATPSSTAEAQSIQIQSNVTKTMIFVSATYAISWLPTYIYYVYINMNPHQYLYLEGGYYASVIFGYLYMCTNPLVYATRFDPVRKVLLRLFRCKNTSE